MNNERFIRTEMLIGPDAMDRLSNAHVCVFGLGGVGGYVAEALARSGVGALTFVDKDTIDVSNTNRQLLATSETVGRLKVDVAKERALSINPLCSVAARPIFFLPETAEELDFSAFDYVVDAVDTVTAKLLIIEKSQAAGVPVISSMGTGNHLNPLAFKVDYIYNSSVCPLAKVMRKESKKRGLKPYKVLYSTEEPITPNTASSDAQPAPGKHSVPASIAFVPSVAGLIIAGEVIKDLAAVFPQE